MRRPWPPWRGDSRKRNEEQPLASKTIGEPAEQERAEHRACKIEAAGKSDLGIGEIEGWAFLERAGNGARKRHFQPVENPGDAKRYDDKSVEPSPAEPVEPRRDGGFDQRRVWLGPHSSVLVSNSSTGDRVVA